MMQIEVDDEIFRHLQERATPLLDTPNSVLRRLLLGEANQRTEGVEQKPVREVRRQAEEQMVEVFVRAALAKLFGGEFLKVSPYRLMYESGKRLIYFQNFNKKGSPKLWYRVHGSAWTKLAGWGKEAYVCFSNPADQFAYVIPVAAIEQKIRESDWKRSDIEVNIDHANSRWVEFNWRIGEYLRRV